MITALYYPHTTIRSRGLIKTALLLWDYVECIVPKRNWEIEKPFDEKSFNEALELITRPYVPNDNEKKQAHSDVSEFLKDYPRFTLEATLRGYSSGRYLMYGNKFLYRTWQILEEGGLAHWDARSSDYSVPPALGLLMMSSLADACAGTQKEKVTDRINAYSLLERMRATLMGAPYVESLDASQVAPELDRLVTLSLKVLDAKDIPIRKLLAYRKREAKGRSSDYRMMRLNYLNALRKYVDRIIKEAKTRQDVKEIERQFREDMRDDLLSLKHELNLSSLEQLFSTGMMALAAVAVGGTLLKPISGLTDLATALQGIGIVPLIKTLLQHRKERRKAMLQHRISWLYLPHENVVSLR